MFLEYYSVAIIDCKRNETMSSERPNSESITFALTVLRSHGFHHEADAVGILVAEVAILRAACQTALDYFGTPVEWDQPEHRIAKQLREALSSPDPSRRMSNGPTPASEQRESHDAKHCDGAEAEEAL